MDITALFKLKSAWDTFSANHPKVPGFVEEIQRRRVTDGTVVDISFRYPDDTVVRTNIRVNETDVDLLNSFLK